MKKTSYVLFLAVTLSLFVGCQQVTEPPYTASDSTVEQTPLVSTPGLDSSQEDLTEDAVMHVLIGAGYPLSAEVQDEEESHKDPNLENSQIPFYFFESEGEVLEYKFTYRYEYQKNELNYYATQNFKQTYAIDSQTNEVRGFVFSDFPQGYDIRTTEVNATEAKEICLAFLQKHFPDIDLSQWVLEIEFDYADYHEYRFVYYKYSHGIQTESLHFELDDCGNIYFFTYVCNGNDTLPQYNDDAYINAAKKRIESFYADKKDVIEIKDYELGKKTNVYIKSLDCYAIDYTVSYTVVYSDGTEEQAGNVFYLPYDENGKAITIEVEETADK